MSTRKPFCLMILSSTTSLLSGRSNHGTGRWSSQDCQCARFHHMGKPEGYNTNIGDRGKSNFPADNVSVSALHGLSWRILRFWFWTKRLLPLDNGIWNVWYKRHWKTIKPVPQLLLPTGYLRLKCRWNMRTLWRWNCRNEAHDELIQKTDTTNGSMIYSRYKQ